MPEGVMVSVVTGAMTSLIGKLSAMLEKEYAQSKGVRRKITFLRNELSAIDAMLRRYAVLEESDPQVRAWMKEERELSYDMEDCIDTFLHRVDAADRDAPVGIYGFFRNLVGKVKKLGARREIAAHIQELEGLVAEASERRARYNLGEEAATLAPAPAAIDPRLPALFVEEARLVGVDEPRDDLIRFLMEGPADSFPRRKVVAIVGSGGAGKTTLANQVYNKIKVEFDCAGFVSVSQNPDINKILKDLHSIAEGECNDPLDDQKILIDCIRKHLKSKRYLIIVDDIWSTSAWALIQCAFPDHNRASRVMATTRNARVANFCCSLHEDLVYEVKPLSSNDSKTLFMRRIFGSDDRWPSHLENVSDQILKKCGGLPLAIVSIASMLANKPLTHEHWVRTLELIGHSLENDPALDDVKKILLLSYHDLPHHLKTCLLYLSIFPEDYRISRDRLIWRWIAEGFIGEGHGSSLEEIGEGYFNELINRSMILPLDIEYDGRAQSCRVHDVMLDLLVSLSTQDNFVTVLGCQSSSVPSKVRRLSLQRHPTELQPIVSLAHVRSLTCFSSAFMPSTTSLKILRVLDLQGCRHISDSHLEIIGHLFQLRYLGLRDTFVRRLPEQIGGLQILQTLDLRCTTVSQLPKSIVQLKQLIQLLIDYYPQLPDGVWDMSALQKLSTIDIPRYPLSFIRQLGKMSQLRDVEIFWNPQYIARGEVAAYEDAFLSMLCELGNQNLRSLSIVAIYTMYGHRVSLDFLVDSWYPHPHLLQKFEAPYDGVFSFSRFPRWLVSLANLSKLVFSIREVKKEDIYLLGGLPSLLFLDLTIEITPEERFIIGSDEFQCLKVLRFACCSSGMGLFIEAKALPKVEELRLQFSLQKTLFLNGGFDLGIQNLSSLRHLEIDINRLGASSDLVNNFNDAISAAAQPSATVKVRYVGLWKVCSSVIGFIFYLRKICALLRTMKRAAKEAHGTERFASYTPAQTTVATATI